MATLISNHENLSRSRDVKGSSDRSFGFVFAVVFAIIGFWPFYATGKVHIWALVVAAVFVGVALVVPKLLAPLNKIWTKFGLLLHKIVNPVIMGLLFYVVITPFGIVPRVLGKKFLDTVPDPLVESYWIIRKPPGPAPECMKDQF